MKNYLVAITATITLFLASCADSISDIERTYQHGIERAEKAQSVQEC